MTKAKAASSRRTSQRRAGSSGEGDTGGSEKEPEAVAPASTVFLEVVADLDPPFDTILSLLQSCSLLPESHDCFQYSQAHIVNNETFAEEFKAFSLWKKESGYTQEELEETFAFLLFDNESEAKLVCQNGLHVGNSGITTLGDPSKGVYISKYADYLHPRPWYHGKAGYIVIFKLIKGKVKVVPENYTTNYTVPTPGYDCHVSESHSKISAQTSHFQAFELSQYYVYEFNNDIVVTRPRQVCPYVILAFHYSEPKRMMTDKNSIGRKTEAFYTAWKGQLLVLGKLLCDVALKSPYRVALPAQMSDKLEIKDILNISDLKKKLPENIFEACSYTDKEVCCEGVYCSLYDVMTSNPDEEKLNQLKDHMKKHELAIVKFLSDQGFLILITSSVLKPSKECGLDEPIALNALFVFPSSRLCMPTGSLEGEDFRIVKRGENMSATVSTLLPGLKYAIGQAKEAQLADVLHPGAQVEEYFQEFVRLRKGVESPPDSQSDDGSSSSPFTFDMLPDFTTPEVCSKRAFSQLGSYITNPSIYALQVSKVMELFSRSSKPLYPVPYEIPEEAFPSVTVTPPELVAPAGAAAEVETVQTDTVNEQTPVTEEIPPDSHATETSEKLTPTRSKYKKKPRRIFLTVKRRKKLPPKALLVAAAADKDVATLKRTTRATTDSPSSPAKEQISVKDADETTLKLASAPCSQKRKRGAEVLTAEVVHKMESESGNKECTSTEDTSSGLSLKRSKRVKKAPLRGLPADQESSTKTLPKKTLKGKGQHPSQKSKPVSKPKEGQSAGGVKHFKRPPFLSQSAFENGDLLNKTIEAVVKSSSSEREALRKSLSPEIYETEGNMSVLAQRMSLYESHALNLLADLALSSGSAYSSAPFSEGFSEEEHHALLGEKLARSVSDHEYSRATKHPKGSGFSGVDKPLNELGKMNSGEESRASQVLEKGYGGVLKVRPDTSSPKKVVLEHSYASSTTEPGKKGPPLKVGSVSSARSKAKDSQEGAPVGRVLPFRPQQDMAGSPNESEFLAEKRKRGMLGPYRAPESSRIVFRRYGKVKVTCKWEEDYVFQSDSKYTSDPLEKTVNRALHGPWDADIPNHVEDVKLILHMWIALFYSKPNKVQNSASRKVVEHNNPAKYVSINSTLDSFELFEDCNGAHKLKVGLADSPSEVEGMAQDSVDDSGSYAAPISSSHLSHNEPSSTSSLGARTTHDGADGYSMPDEGQQCVSSSGYFDISSSNYMMNADEHERAELLESEPVEEICISEPQANEDDGERNELLESEAVEDTCSSGPQADENETAKEELMESETVEEISSSIAEVDEIGRQVLVESKTVEDICASVPQVDLNGFEREELLKSVTVVEICSNVPQVEREELLESETVVDVCSNEPQDDYDEPERDDYLESETVEDICSSVSQVNENDVLREETLEPEAVVEIRSGVPQVEENEIGREILFEPEHFVEICTSTSQVDENETEREPLLEPESVVEICTSAPQVEQHEMEDFMEPETVVEVCSTVSQVNENEMPTEDLRQSGTVVDICSSAPQVLCPILVSSFPEMHCRVLKKYIIAQKRGGQLTEWSTQLYDMVNGNQTARGELLHPQTVVDLCRSLPQVFQVSETETGRDQFLEPEEVETVVEVCSTDAQVGENDTEEVVESEIVTDIGNSFSFDNCYDSTITHESHLTGHPDGASNALDTERSAHKDRSDRLAQVSEHVASVEPVLYYETVVSENNSEGDMFISVEDKEDYEEPAHEITPPQEEFADNEEVCVVLDYESGKLVRVKANHECTGTNTDTSARDSMVNSSSYGNEPYEVHISENQKADRRNYLPTDGECNALGANSAAANSVYDRAVESLVEANLNNTQSVDLSREEKPSTDSHVLFSRGNENVAFVYKHFILQQSNYVDRNTSYIPLANEIEHLPVHESSHVPGQEEHPSSVTELPSAAEVAESAKNDQREDCLLYFENIENVSPASTHETLDQEDKVVHAGEERPVGNIMDSPERQFGEESIACEEPPDSRRMDLGDEDHAHVSTAVPCADAQKDMSGRQRSDQFSPPHSANTFKELKGVTEGSRVEFGDASISRVDEVSPRARLKRHHCKNPECEGGECICKQVFTHAEKQSSHGKCVRKHKGCSDVLQDDRRRTKPPRTFRNFSVTKDVKETRIALHGFQREHAFAERSDFLSSWTKRCVARDDVTRNTLDIEYLRFIHKVNQVIKTQAVHTQTMGRLPIRKKNEGRSRSPLLITVMRSEPRRAAPVRKAEYYAHEYEEPSLSARFKEHAASSRRHSKKHRHRNRDHTSFHFNKLNYKNKSREQDISGATNESAQSSSVFLSGVTTCKTVIDQNTTPEEEPVAQTETSAPFTQETTLLKNIITDLCSSLHSRLSSVASQACKKLLWFSIVEIEAEPYFSEIKTMLKKDGYTETDPLQFCQAEHADESFLTIIIRNEDIATHIHEIPDLLQLKLLPNITFAGVDSPEDLTDGTYQKLFHSGGFVVSDETVLETITLGQLQEVINVLEKLNRHERWKWLLHYRESKKMKEDSKAESVAKKKDLLIKSCQESNIVEVLHYHQCDSKSAVKSEDLTCLLNLQIQHIGTRFAVFLTDKPNIVKEGCKKHGILVADVNTFVEMIQRLASSFKFW